MKLVVFQSNISANSNYYIALDPGAGHFILWGDDIVKMLNIPYNTYAEFIISHRGYWDKQRSDYFFSDEKSAQAMIKDLEPYIILTKLTGDL